jgi:acyl-CoA reductase-like NAD-dependent aldehyde dehydrogenase
VAFGGEAIERNADGQSGFYLRPALITESTASMRINREEVLGPVVSVLRVRVYEEALAQANDTPF